MIQTRPSRLTSDDYAKIASLLVDRHGPDAVDWANRAIGELEDKGEAWRAAAWKRLRGFIVDVIDGAPARLQ